jgi:hypothetical protein
LQFECNPEVVRPRLLYRRGYVCSMDTVESADVYFRRRIYNLEPIGRLRFRFPEQDRSK